MDDNTTPRSRHCPACLKHVAVHQPWHLLLLPFASMTDQSIQHGYVATYTSMPNLHSGYVPGLEPTLNTYASHHRCPTLCPDKTLSRYKYVLAIAVNTVRVESSHRFKTCGGCADMYTVSLFVAHSSYITDDISLISIQKGAA